MVIEINTHATDNHRRARKESSREVNDQDMSEGGKIGIMNVVECMGTEM